MKNLLVTGGSGFIGCNFIRYILCESDFNGRIINVDKLTYAGNPENLADIEKEFKDRYIFIKEDICNQDAMDSIFKDYSVDSVCHFAAESHVDRSISGPSDFIRTNIVGTFNLLECARKYKDDLKLFHHISTDEVFGSLGAEGFFTEETSYKPNSPYSASKASSDHIVRAYNKTYGIPVTISNCSNNYGPFQFPEKLIPLIILNALSETSLPVYGDGKNVRDWLYVKDHCMAIKLIMEKGVRGETYNIGGNNEIENIRIVELICDYIDTIKKPEKHKTRRELIEFVTDRPGHDRRYAIDSTKIQETLGWKPVESFKTGLEKTIKWYLENNEWIEHIKSGEYQTWIAKHYRNS